MIKFYLHSVTEKKQWFLSETIVYYNDILISGTNKKKKNNSRMKLKVRLG